MVEKICRKKKVDEATTKLRVSYFPFTFQGRKLRPNYIRDDEDVVCYYEDVSEEGLRSVLHVEVTNDVEQNQGIDENEGFDQVLREDLVRGYVANNEDIPLVGGADDSGGGVLAMYVGEPSQQYPAVVENEDRDVEGNASEAILWVDEIDITVGQEFRSKEAIQSLVEKAGHNNVFEFVVKKSEPLRYVVACSEAHNGCDWYIRAARRDTTKPFSIRTHRNIHSCSRSSTSTGRRSRRKGTPTMVASLLAEDYPGKLTTPPPKDLIDLVQGRFGVQVSYSTAWRGKKEAANDIRGTPEDGFRLVHSYMYMLEKMNHGTVSYVEVDEEQKFKYLFFALGASIEGFQVMRKVIIVDGTHLKTAYGGVLIVATAQDPDHHHYPIAFGVVDGEKNDSWTWFLKKLKTVIPDDPQIVFISDRNQSLIKAIAEVYPSSHHGHCIFHLSQNVKLKVFGVNKAVCGKKFRECARAYTEAEFLRLYEVFSSTYPSARTYLDEWADVTKWARCYFRGEKYNIDTSNSVESINGVLERARNYSLLQLIDAIVGKIAEWFAKHRKASGLLPSGQYLVPFVEKELHITIKKAKKLVVRELNGYNLEYSVIGGDGKIYLVDLRSKTCSCRRFDIDKYPCVHAIAATLTANKDAAPELRAHDLSSKYYWIELWVLAYTRTIYPVPHNSQWVLPEEIMQQFAYPPDYEVKQGRRQETRFPSVGEHRGRKKRSHGAGGLGEWFTNDGDVDGDDAGDQG
ncbi:MULE transposase N-terminal all-beta domain [Arabidopsis suecica]|uniref:MULE transposase N-terminal all-beta domain n=1 Tax=Arabidopsis suecica TaxID=45249 RepID=A0A8T1ZSY8_ARASU|nr:MULE transposase N-terminal all-beta domain [Arabidopsis suecica]